MAAFAGTLGAASARGSVLEYTQCRVSEFAAFRLRRVYERARVLRRVAVLCKDGALFGSFCAPLAADRMDGRSVNFEAFRIKAKADAGSEVEKEKADVLKTGVLDLWRNAKAVCFDVDSTVCEEEGIDELAAFCGAGDLVSAWTARAMGGSVPFEVALAARLELFTPSASTLADFLASRPPRLSPRIKDLVSKLHSRGTDVYLVSGGFRQMIEPVAALLGIPKDRIYANTLLFEKSGKFQGFDAKEPTARSGGKATVIEKIKQEHGYKILVMVGDGATDLEAKRPGGADMFICYGGVVVRPKVVEGSDWFVTSFDDLIDSLEDRM